MKKLYPFIFFALLITGCSKDFLKRYDKRIEGRWELYDTDRHGIGGATGHLAFTEGIFEFKDNGILTYTAANGSVYQGTWDIKKHWINDAEVHSLLLSATNFTTQDLRTEYFDEMDFTGTNRFRTIIYSNSHTYVSKFKRL